MAIARARQANELKEGRRGDNWIQNTFNDTEENILASLKDLDGPKTWDLATINAAYRKALAQQEPTTSAQLPTFTLVKGLSVNYISDFNKGEPAIVQVPYNYKFFLQLLLIKGRVYRKKVLRAPHYVIFWSLPNMKRSLKLRSFATA